MRTSIYISAVFIGMCVNPVLCSKLGSAELPMIIFVMIFAVMDVIEFVRKVIMK